MAIAIIVGRDLDETKRFDWFINEWRRVFLALDPTLDIRIWPEVGDVNDIDAAFCWLHPHGILKKFPNLKCIASLAAGVDRLLADAELPKNIPIVRVTDPYMANDIVQYALASVLHYVKRLGDWETNQEKKLWTRNPPINYSHKTIGVMGLGYLGQKAAETFSQIGLKVIGWSRTAKTISGVTCFSGQSDFFTFLSQADILICMLPLTPDTRDILNANTFSHLPRSAYLVNIGRGEHLVDEDLIAALHSGQISGACLDVQRQEPMPPDHLLWTHPGIRITPHIASVTNPETAAPQMLENYKRALRGEALLNQVDVGRGY